MNCRAVNQKYVNPIDSVELLLLKQAVEFRPMILEIAIFLQFHRVMTNLAFSQAPVLCLELISQLAVKIF